MKQKDIEISIKDLEYKLFSLNFDLKESKKRKLLKCDKCHKRTKVSLLTYIQSHYYVRPSGCIDGDYWLQSEGGYSCPKCGDLNRLYKYNRPEEVKLKPYFKEILDKY